MTVQARRYGRRCRERFDATPAERVPAPRAVEPAGAPPQPAPAPEQPRRN